MYCVIHDNESSNFSVAKTQYPSNSGNLHAWCLRTWSPTALVGRPPLIGPPLCLNFQEITCTYPQNKNNNLHSDADWRLLTTFKLLVYMMTETNGRYQGWLSPLIILWSLPGGKLGSSIFIEISSNQRSHITNLTRLGNLQWHCIRDGWCPYLHWADWHFLRMTYHQGTKAKPGQSVSDMHAAVGKNRGLAGHQNTKSWTAPCFYFLSVASCKIPASSVVLWFLIFQLHNLS